jgi:hypothetical protein
MLLVPEMKKAKGVSQSSLYVEPLDDDESIPLWHPSPTRASPARGILVFLQSLSNIKWPLADIFNLKNSTSSSENENTLPDLPKSVTNRT